MMKMQLLSMTVLMFCVGYGFHSNAQLTDSGFFRIVGTTNSIITDFDASTGMISWSNEVAAATNTVQTSLNLHGTNVWNDYVQVAATSEVSSVQVINFNTPSGMVFIPGGSNFGQDPDRWVDPDNPDVLHYWLTVDSFFMDATEVTKAEWDTVYNWAVMHGYDFIHSGSGKASDHPVQTVNWFECLKWCNARSEMEGRTPCYTIGVDIFRTGESVPTCNLSFNGYRLPTNAEWEYAARGGLRSKRFPWGDTINHFYANYKANSSYADYDTSPYTTGTFHPLYDEGGGPYTSPVGSFPANGYGLYDMTGNVIEWCWDTFPSAYGDRCNQGGSWHNYAYNVRLKDKFWTYPSFHKDYLGFRTVCH